MSAAAARRATRGANQWFRPGRSRAGFSRDLCRVLLVRRLLNQRRNGAPVHFGARAQNTLARIVAAKGGIMHTDLETRTADKSSCALQRLLRDERGLGLLEYA